MRGSASLLLLALVLSACGPSQQAYEALEQRVVQLEEGLDACRYGPERSLLAIRDAYEKGDYPAVVASTRALVEQYAGTPEAREAEHLAAQAAEDIARQHAEELAQREAEAAHAERALAGLRKKTDAMRGITWYYHRTTPQDVNSQSDIHLYFGRQDNGRPLPPRLSIQYVADDWLFIEQFIIKADDKVFTIIPGYRDVENEKGERDIWEWYDEVASNNDIAMIEAIIASNTAVIRYDGNRYFKDRTITRREKNALRDVLAAYRSMKVEASL